MRLKSTTDYIIRSDLQSCRFSSGVSWVMPVSNDPVLLVLVKATTSISNAGIECKWLLDPVNMLFAFSELVCRC